MKIQKSARKSGLQKLVISASIAQNLSRLTKLRFQPENIYMQKSKWMMAAGWDGLLKNLYASREELQKELKKEEEKKIAEIKAKIKNAGDLVAFMYDHCVACAEEYTDWTARRAVKEIAKEMLGLDLD